MFKRVCLLVLVAACGDNGSTKTVDAGIDAEMADASPPITVTVHFRDESPAAGIDVVFGDASGAVVATMQTDANGVATIPDSSNVAMATIAAFDSMTPYRQLSTWMGLRGGDNLLYTLWWGPDPAPFSATFEITVPANPPATTDGYILDYGCEATQTGAGTFMHTIQNDCRRPNSNLVDVALIARSGSTDLGFAVMPGVALDASGTTTLDFPDGWRTDWLDFQVDYTNMPAGATSLRTYFTLDVHGHTFFPGSSQTTAVTQGDSVSSSRRFANGLATGIRYSFQLAYGTGDPHGGASYSKGVPVGASAAMDVAAAMMPPVTSVSTDDSTVRPVVTWTQAGTHAGASDGGVFLSWQDAAWDISFPPDTSATSITAPALPDSLAAFRPPTDGSVSGNMPVVSFRKISLYPTYDAFKNDHTTVLDPTMFEINSTRFPGF